MNVLGTLKRLVFNRKTLLVAAAAAVAAAVVPWTSRTSQNYITHSPSITQTFNGVLSETMLTDFCYQVQGIQGVTGVSYRDFSATRRTATITVYYNPQMTSVRQIKIFMQGSGVLWRTPKAT